MNSIESIKILIRKDLKMAAQKYASEIGVSLDTLVRSYLKHLVFTGKVHLSVSHKPSAYLESVIIDAVNESRRSNI